MAANSSEYILLGFLQMHGIEYTRVDHPPVYTCEEARMFRLDSPGLETKNLFLRDERHHFYLVMTDCGKRLDLKALGRKIDAPKLQFGSPEQLFEILGLTPGAVTVLGLINDPGQRVELLVDAEFWPAAAYLCHPMVNTATLVLDHANLVHFLEITGHPAKIVEMTGLRNLSLGA
jgi:Ala-tRNA(Pro) deacylase